MMTRTKTLFALFILACLAPVAALALVGDAGYNYISPEMLKGRIESGSSQVILDIQVKEQFDKHHIRGAMATYAYPVKTDAEKARLEAVYRQLASHSDPVVIVCPRGGGGATRTYDYLAAKGVDTGRLLILEKGQGGWPYEELLENSRP